jgi:hypothetical protein
MQFQNVQFCSRSRNVKILTTLVRSARPTGQAGIHGVFRGLKFEPDADIGQKGATLGHNHSFYFKTPIIVINVGGITYLYPAIHLSRPNFDIKRSAFTVTPRK